MLCKMAQQIYFKVLHHVIVDVSSDDSQGVILSYIYTMLCQLNQHIYSMLLHHLIVDDSADDAQGVILSYIYTMLSVVEQEETILLTIVDAVTADSADYIMLITPSYCR